MIKQSLSSQFSKKKIQSCLKQLVKNNSFITWNIRLLTQIEIDILSFLKCILVMIKSFHVWHSYWINLRSDLYDIEATHPTGDLGISLLKTRPGSGWCNKGPMSLSIAPVMNPLDTVTITANPQHQKFKFSH